MIEIANPVPGSVVDDSGRPAFGAYRGMMEVVRWDGLARPWAVGAVTRIARAKKWQYASIASERVVAACCIVQLGYASNAFAYVFDREARAFAFERAWTAGPGAARVSDRPGGGAGFAGKGTGRNKLSNQGARATARGQGGRATLYWNTASPTNAAIGLSPKPTWADYSERCPEAAMEIGPDAIEGGWRVRVRADDVVLDAVLDQRGAPSSLCAVADLGGGRVNATHKSVGLVARGEARVGGRRWDLSGSAALDHTSGLLHRETRWRWASASGPGLGLNIVSGFNGPIENVAWLGDRLWALGPISIEIDNNDPLRNWNLRSEPGAAVTVDLRFEPEGARRANTNLIVAKSIYAQPVGAFGGLIRTPDGVVHQIDGLAGVTEDHVAVW